MNSKSKHNSLLQRFAHEFLLNGKNVTGRDQWKYICSILSVSISFVLSIFISVFPCFGYLLLSLLIFSIFIWTLTKMYRFVTKCEDKGLLITHHRIRDTMWITFVATPLIYTWLKSFIPTQTVLIFIFGLLSLRYANDMDNKRILLNKLNNLNDEVKTQYIKLNSISNFVGWNSINDLKSSLKVNINNATNIDDLTNINNSLSSQLSSLSGKSNSASNYRSRINSAIDLLDDTSSLYSEIISKASAASNDANKANDLLNKNK